MRFRLLWYRLKAGAAVGNHTGTNSILTLRPSAFAARDSVASVTDVFVVESNDARIYFQTVHGRKELIRILPIDYDKTE